MAPLPRAGEVDYTTIAQLVEPTPIPRRPDAPTVEEKRRDPFQFGQRYLEEGDDIYAYNAWDHVETDAEYREFAENQYEKQRADPVSDFDRRRFNSDPVKWWNLFYKNNSDKFFKNRKWLQQEFPVLGEVTKADAGPKVVLEVGAGAGNTAFPILAHNENEELRMHACDFSKKAVDVMRGSEDYNEKYMSADVWDVAGEGEGALPPGLSEGSVDVVIMIFIFSALSPTQWERAVSNIYNVLKPGGLVLFRDYGRGDLAQVRFKKGRWMGDNFYVRGDGTRVYFFEKDQLEHIWCKWSPKTGMPPFDPSEDETTESGISTTDEQTTGFELVRLAPDNRLTVNRQKKLKMYRCWMQGSFQKKPAHPNDTVVTTSEDQTGELKN